MKEIVNWSGQIQTSSYEQFFFLWEDFMVIEKKKRFDIKISEEGATIRGF